MSFEVKRGFWILSQCLADRVPFGQSWRISSGPVPNEDILISEEFDRSVSLGKLACGHPPVFRVQARSRPL